MWILFCSVKWLSPAHFTVLRAAKRTSGNVQGNSHSLSSLPPVALVLSPVLTLLLPSSEHLPIMFPSINHLYWAKFLRVPSPCSAPARRGQFGRRNALQRGVVWRRGNVISVAGHCFDESWCLLIVRRASFHQNPEERVELMKIYPLLLGSSKLIEVCHHRPTCSTGV